MPIPGYTDFQRTQFAGGAILLNYTGTLTNGQLLGNFFVHQWSAINLHLQQLGASTYAIRLTWFTDNTFSGGWQQPFFTVGPDTNINISVPVQAAVLQVDALLISGPGGDTVKVYMLGRTEETRGYELNEGQDRPLLTNNPAYGISQTQNFGLNYDYYGNAWFQVIPALTTNPIAVAIQYYDIGTPGNLVYLQWWNITRNAPINQMIPILAPPITVVIANGGAAQSIQTLLTPLAA